MNEETKWLIAQTRLIIAGARRRAADMDRAAKATLIVIAETQRRITRPRFPDPIKRFDRDYDDLA